ncbi:MAG TPA: hypothetical protein VFW71_14275 [Actinomycetota bacterium]|nr:hypothetical protein [Actinomycetota bacterium]
MDIEEFYAADKARREGDDNSFGMDWTDATRPHNTFDLYWNDRSHELYLMAKPVNSPWLGYVKEALLTDIRELEWVEHHIVGAAEHLIHPRHIQAKTGSEKPEAPDHWKDALAEELAVEVLGVIPTLDQADAVLQGWKVAMPQPDSIAWLRARLEEQGIAPQ